MPSDVSINFDLCVWRVRICEQCVFVDTCFGIRMESPCNLDEKENKEEDGVLVKTLGIGDAALGIDNLWFVKEVPVSSRDLNRKLPFTL